MYRVAYTTVEGKEMSTKLTKNELAELAARAMNLLNNLKSNDNFAEDEHKLFDKDTEGEFWALTKLLPEDERHSFYNNATLRARDLATLTGEKK